jgi:hypothetical protein
VHTTRLMNATELYSKLTAAFAAAAIVLVTLLL